MRADGDALARGGAIRLAIEVRRRSSAIGPRSRAARDGAARRRRDATRDRTIDGSDASDDRSNAGRWIIAPRRRAIEAKARANGAPMDDARGGRGDARARERGSARTARDDGEGRDDGSNAEAVVDRRKYLDGERRRREGGKESIGTTRLTTRAP